MSTRLVLSDTGANFAAWESAFHKAAPELALVHDQPARDLSGIRHCMTWKPLPGVYDRMPDLEALFVLGAGVERFLADATIPPRVRIVKIALYSLNGMFVGVAAALMVGQLSSASPNMGSGLELSAIAAVAVGGTPLAGGRGGIPGTILGVLLLGLIANSLNLLSITGNLQYVIQGMVIIVAVMAQRGSR